jgi:signal transduction histidine kinase
MVIFTVEDNGIGIKPDKADKLFQKFYQIDTGPIRQK